MQTTTRRDPSAKPRPMTPHKTGGERLPTQTDSRMSAAFGHDFSSVRIFHDDDAAAQAEGLGAQAFARGGDLFFQRGFYDPHGAQGQRLLAHELTHVVQEQRFGTGDKPNSEASDASEREAEAVAGRAAAGETVQVRQAPGAAVARHEQDDGDFARGRRRLQALENYGQVSGAMRGTAPSPATPQPGVAPAEDVEALGRSGLSRQQTQRAAPRVFSDFSDLQGRLEGAETMRRGTQVSVGGEPLILGGGNSPEARIRGSRLPNLGTYPEIAGGLRGFGLDDSQMAFAQEIYRRTGQMPEGAGFAGLRANPEAPGMFDRMGLLNSVEGARVAQHPTDLSISNHLVIEGGMNFDGMYGEAPADPKAKPAGGELPATHQMAGASDRAVVDRLAMFQDPELMDRLRSQGLNPMQVLLNDRGRGGAALGRRTQLVDSRLGLFDGLLAGGPPPDHPEAVPFALDRLSRVPTPAGQHLWPGVGPGTRGSGPTAGGDGAAPVAEAAPPPTPDAHPAAPAPNNAPQEAAPAGEGVPAGTTGAETAHVPMGQAALLGGAGAGTLAAIHDLAIKRDFSLDSAGDIALQTGAGAAGNMTQEALAARVGGGVSGGVKAGGAVGAITSGLFSTYNNGELYRQGKETAGQATANTLVDTGLGLGTGLAAGAGGAELGAMAGSVVPGLGTAIGAGVGFVGGMAVSYGANWLAEHSGFTNWAKQGLGSELNHFNHGLSGVWDGVGHATEGIHDAWGGAKSGLRHAGHAISDGASGVLHGAEHLGLNALHGAEHLGSDVLHGGEHLAARALHGGEQLASNALQGGAHLLQGVEHAGVNALHGAEHLGSSALHGAEDAAQGVGNAAAGAWHKLTGWL